MTSDAIERCTLFSPSCRSLVGMYISPSTFMFFLAARFYIPVCCRRVSRVSRGTFVRGSKLGSRAELRNALIIHLQREIVVPFLFHPRHTCMHSSGRVVMREVPCNGAREEDGEEEEDVDGDDRDDDYDDVVTARKTRTRRTTPRRRRPAGIPVNLRHTRRSRTVVVANSALSRSRPRARLRVTRSAVHALS